MKCRACGADHSPMLTCGRAARIAEFEAAQKKPKVAALLDKKPEPLDKPPVFDKTAYQREYMRRRRAEAKAAKAK